MVCKEEVLLWFKDLDSYTRIDVLYELLNMCLPFELRFIGSCVEEIGKHTYQELRGPTITANDLEKLSKDPLLSHGILEETVRHRLLIYLSLLSSRNYSVSNWLYRKLLRTDHIEEYLVKEKGKDDMLHSEFLLLYTMALHHPAFTFEQKQFFSRVLSNLIDFKENRVSAKHSSLGYPPGFGYPTNKQQCQCSQLYQQPVAGGAIPTAPKHSPPSSMTCSTAAGGDAIPHPTPMAYHHQQPPGLPQLPPMPPHLDFVPAPPPSGGPATVWSARPGFPYGAPPEVPPFPSAVTASVITPLVTGAPPPAAISPASSRSSSPHRTSSANQQPSPVSSSVMVPPPTPMGVPPPLPAAPPTLEQLDQLTQQPPPPPVTQFVGEVGHMATVEEVEQQVKMNSMEEKHLREILWPHHLHHPHHHPPIPPGDAKPNGVRFPAYIGGGKVRPYLVEQMHALHLDGENSSLHQSNSSVGSCSSPEDTPPSTPKSAQPTVVMPPPPPPVAIIATGQPTTATTPHHGPGRGDKARTNGLPYSSGPSQQQQLPPVPPQQQAVPSAPLAVQQPPAQQPTAQPQQVVPLPDTSSPPPQQTATPTFANSSVPYAFQQFAQLPPNSPFPTRPPGCYNCGSPNHQGAECAVQHIDEITQKKAYQLEYTAPPPTQREQATPTNTGQEAEK